MALGFWLGIGLGAIASAAIVVVATVIHYSLLKCCTGREAQHGDGEL